VQRYELDKVKKEMKEEAEAKKRQDLNLDLAHLKKRYLYPFGDIAPIRDQNDQGDKSGGGEFESVAFQKLVSKKY